MRGWLGSWHAGVHVVMEIGHRKEGGLEGRIGASQVLDVTDTG